MKVLIDTNVLVSSLSSKSSSHWIIIALLEQQYELFVTTEVLLEYEEVLRAKYSEFVAGNFLVALRELPNVHDTAIYFKWNLITDADDNKFVDCYVASGATYIVTEDAHFAVLHSVLFPRVNILSIAEFKLVLETGDEY